jgi:hypothetical protein
MDIMVASIYWSPQHDWVDVRAASNPAGLVRIHWT